MQQRSEATRARILDTAQKLFAQSGYDATGVAEICQAARVSKGAFYHHFSTKQEIFLELLRGWLAVLDAGLNAVWQESKNIPQALAQMSGMVQGVFEDAHGRLPMFLEFWDQSSHDSTVWQETVAPYRRYQAFFAKMMEAGIREGSLREIDPEMAARVVVALALGLLLQGLLDPQGTDWQQATQQGMQYLMNGIAKEKL